MIYKLVKKYNMHLMMDGNLPKEFKKAPEFRTFG